MLADLHFHSKFSDGTLWPDEMVEMAAERGLEMIALTDHDTFEGVHDFLISVRKYGMTGVPGIEIDFVDPEYGFVSELLGYFPQGQFAHTQAYLSHFSNLRRALAVKALEIAGRLYDRHDLSCEELLELKLEGRFPQQLQNRISLTKPDIYNYFLHKMIPLGYAEYREFKELYFRHEEMAGLIHKPLFSKCLENIVKDGGFAVLAHPAYQFGKKVDNLLHHMPDYLKMLEKARSAGLWGLELHAYDHPEEASSLNAVFKEIAGRVGLQVTYGSDSHGPGHSKKHSTIGCNAGEFGGFEPLKGPAVMEKNL